MNPEGDDHDYDVADLDKALLDRFNRYEFRPDADEWIDWAIKEKVHKYVIGFIIKNKSFLDPQTLNNKNANTTKAGEVYPSRRSWHRVSDILNANPNILHEDGMNLFKTTMMGVVGTGATSKFANYIKEVAKNISAGMIVTRWDKRVEAEIKTLVNQEIVHLNKELSIYIDAECDTLFEASSAKEAETYADNVGKYLKVIPKELAAEFVNNITEANTNKRPWANRLLELSPQIVNWFVNVLHGDNEHDKSVGKMIEEDNKDKDWSGDEKGPDDTDDPDWSSGDSGIDDIIKGN